ncbi:Dam family site-specific DNA-(adenine-N6)-methyltransferase [Aliikangiella coralliicola]|uniref:Site-specific DNA-methyltransferase (adenine-specific) n=1 Tax=Aliikangiella coralliicola TaxID=2592383 RepID=A0A545UJU4_9GAMM|nr:Dam family site-specific DNA-(adenine-N6)-methyltransferase [Aliikangiella coralliicola]TQV89724.1 Dam family site-specific DNA-(adenine-N6)-methyltransferase [Aliikangiella coralliicola]
MQQLRSRPFLKWAGGKYRLLDKLAPHLKGRKLIEPFVGSGAVFLNQDFERYLLGDINPDLINLYQCLKQEKRKFINYARSFFNQENNSQKAYLQFREEFNNGLKGRRRAALFVYLNRHGFNGLCRYNKSGGFNVPFGRYVKPYFPEKEMYHFLVKAKQAKFVCGDFVALMNRSRRGDVVYCDPPYVPLSPTASFTSYAAQGFSYDQQVELAYRAKHLSERGVKVIISNHDNAITRQIYEDAKIEAFPVRRFISCDGNKRGNASELLAIYE